VIDTLRKSFKPSRLSYKARRDFLIFSHSRVRKSSKSADLNEEGTSILFNAMSIGGLDWLKLFDMIML